MASKPEPSSPPCLAVIVAISKNHKIGSGDKLPWHIPSDLAYFKEVTSGKAVIMGRKTWETVKSKRLNSAGRSIIAVSRDVAETRKKTSPYSAIAVGSVDDAIGMAKHLSRLTGQPEIIVAGGKEIYLQTLEKADKIYLTVVDSESVDGDVELPEFSEASLLSKGWSIASKTAMDKKDADQHSAEFIVLTKTPHQNECA